MRCKSAGGRRHFGSRHAYNSPPPAIHLGKQTTVDDCAKKICGIGGDHTTDQFKTAGLIEKWKKDATYLVLAHNHFGSDKSEASHALQSLISTAVNDAVTAAGGEENWGKLTKEAWVAATVEATKGAKVALRKSLYQALSKEEKRPLDLFLCLGCAGRHCQSLVLGDPLFGANQLL